MSGTTFNKEQTKAFVLLVVSGITSHKGINKWFEMGRTCACYFIMMSVEAILLVGQSHRIVRGEYEVGRSFLKWLVLVLSLLNY